MDVERFNSDFAVEGRVPMFETHHGNLEFYIYAMQNNINVNNKSMNT
jgi:hypothetical protein